MNKKNLTIPSLFKGIGLILLLLLIALLIYFTFLYNEIQDTKTKGFSEAEQRVLQETTIKEIEHINRFYGESGFHVITGKTDENKTQIVFVPDNEEEELTIINENEIMSLVTLKELWQQKCANCRLIDIVPAMINKDALWEITYIDDANRYVLDYVSIFDGSQYEEFRFKKMFE